MDTENKLIERLTATQGDVQAQAALMAEFRLSVYSEPQRLALREAMDAAAVLHWFDAGLLAQLLEMPAAEATARFEELKALTFVEHYGRRNLDLFNVHEATRLGWRRKLAAEDRDRFRALSARAGSVFTWDQTPAGRVEWVYYLLCADPDAGAGALESMKREWGNSARPEDYSALARALGELDSTGLVVGRARVWTLLVLAFARAARGETSQLCETAAAALDLARDAADESAEYSAHVLLGEAWQVAGSFDDAHAEFAKAQAISRHLVKQNPRNAEWHRKLAVVCNRMGKAALAQGQITTAETAFAEALTINLGLTAQAPRNQDLQQAQEVEALAGRRRVSATRVRLKPRPPVWGLGTAT